MSTNPKDIDRRIKVQLDRLENPHLSEADIQKIKRKIELLKSMK